MLAIAEHGRPYARLQVSDTANTWTFKLCGRGKDCSITPGRPTETRGQLIRREALQLALYTFKFDPQIDSVAIYLPPPPHAGPSRTLLYLQRDQLARQISKPLDQTLALATPPLPDVPDRTEQETIDRLTLPNLFAFSMTRIQDGGVELVLSHTY